ncbi:uncharacterized protein HfgLR_22220 (plasmid) [Haloferax gibbonsii]|uniref:Uncharacterized protein n=1 Tax=Haloferax gibbonsii TaxID=35746 RepID=A0A871BKU9_HALGI|nr:hypothetical protein [Haloferax gibbonsii]QOS13652.1 uncharacterized protein HfgLR_22220 [Haloferax gibbonsii]
MSPSTSSATRRRAWLCAFQWGLVQAFVLDTLGRFLRNYYRATTGVAFPPDWVVSIQFAAPLGLLVGGFGGYRWVTSGRSAASASAHRKRVVFVGALFVGWALAIVPTTVFQLVLDERLFTVPYFVLPTLTALSVFAGASLLAYRAEAGWYRKRRNRLVGGAAGGCTGVLVGVFGFVVYSWYLLATQTNYSLNGGAGIVAAACVGAAAGYARTEGDRAGDRAREYLVLLLVSALSLSLAVGLVTLALAVVGVSVFLGSSVVVPAIPVVGSVALAGYLAFVAETTLVGRFVDG